MSASELSAWVCPDCGRTNDDPVCRCGHRAGDATPRAVSEWAARPDHAPAAAGRRERTVLLLLPAVAFIVWLYLVWEFHKWDAQWGCANVIIAGLAAAFVAGWLLLSTYWYHDHGKPTGRHLHALVVTGFVICAAAGIYFTEPIEHGGSVTRAGESPTAADRRSADYRYDYSRTRAADYYILWGLLDLGSGVADVDDEAGAVILIVLLVVALICGSALVPHFWVAATLVLIVLMALLAYREWRIVSPGVAQQVGNSNPQ